MSDYSSLLSPPPGLDALPSFSDGWVDGPTDREAFLSYVPASTLVNWSEDLESLHEESSRDHFIDVWTRRAMLARLGRLPSRPVIADVGCSSGYLLEDLCRTYPGGTLVGVDLIASGLRKAHEHVPGALLVLADACRLPLRDSSVDAVASANLLEHVPDDLGALAEVARVLRPGATAVFVVPAGPSTYDYYDRFLGHERRYASGELAGKARRVGLEVVEDLHLGSLVYPAFWLVKKRNRRLYGDLEGEALEARVASSIDATRSSRVGALACNLEQRLLSHGVRLPFGIRSLTVLKRPAARS